MDVSTSTRYEWINNTSNSITNRIITERNTIEDGRNEPDYSFKPWIINDKFWEEQSSYQSVKISLLKSNEEYIPRTALGRRLLILRRRAIKKGMKLLSPDEVLEEVERRRGEI